MLNLAIRVLTAVMEKVLETAVVVVVGAVCLGDMGSLDVVVVWPVGSIAVVVVAVGVVLSSQLKR